MMDSNALCQLIGRVLMVEEQADEKVAKSRWMKEGAEARNKLCAYLREVEHSGDLPLIVKMEKSLIQRELEKYANTDNTKSSLKKALNDMEYIEKGINYLENPELYRVYSDNLVRSPNRDKKGLPRDAAREAFRAQNARLSSEARGRGTVEEKEVLEQRAKNIRAAEKLYIERQKRVLEKSEKEKAPRGRGAAQKRT
jgi:hypothetical protein